MINRKQIEGAIMLIFAGICFWLPQHMQKPGAADHRILVATDKLKGGLFDHAVLLVVRHNGYGASGFVLNGKAAEKGGAASGGPAGKGNYYTLHSLDVREEDTHLMTDIQAAWTEGEAFARSLGTTKKKPEEYIILQGSAGWGMGQLNKEIERGAWKIIPYNENMVFHTDPAKMYAAAMAARPVPAVAEEEEKEDGKVW